MTLTAARPTWCTGLIPLIPLSSMSIRLERDVASLLPEAGTGSKITSLTG